MRTKYLLGMLAVVVLILAVWLVPMALATIGDAPESPETNGQAQSQSSTQCPFLQAHPWLDPHGSAGGSGGATSGAGTQVFFY
jgi:hypothetical protein